MQARHRQPGDSRQIRDLQRMGEVRLYLRH